MALSKEQSELLKKIQADNEANGASWIAGETSMLYLTESERKRLFGAADDPNDIPLAERVEMSRKNYEEYLAKIKIAGLGDAPALFDWRNVGGDNFISPIKNQGGCGSCVAFGTAAAIDAAMRIAANTPVGSSANNIQDLSEAQLFYCGAGQQGITCTTGWWASAALSYCQNTGLVPESSYPYTAGDQPGNLPDNWQSLITKITCSSYLTDIQLMKNMLAASGPLVIPCFAVYQDFWVSYCGGVYKWNGTSPLVGRHCVCLVGYDDNQQAWICKNSWGTGWGIGGYFLMGYGQCGIDASMYGVNSFSVVYPFNPSSNVYTLTLDKSGNSSWSPHDPNEYAGWLDGDQLIINCSFNTNPSGPNPLPPASDYNGLSLGAGCNADQAGINALLSQIQGLSGTTGQLIGSGITSSPNNTSGAVIFYNAQSAVIQSIQLQPDTRGTLTDFIYQWKMIYNGKNTIVNNERQAAIVFGYGYQLSGIINNQ